MRALVGAVERNYESRNFCRAQCNGARTWTVSEDAVRTFGSRVMDARVKPIPTVSIPRGMDPMTLQSQVSRKFWESLPGEVGLVDCMQTP